MKTISSTKFNINSDKFFTKRGGNVIPNSLAVFFKISQLVWILLNHTRIIRDSTKVLPVDSCIEIKKFQLTPESIDWECSSKQSSPARFLSDLFWMHQDWDLINNLLNHQIRAVDIGCGTGIYLEKLMKYGASFSSYYGFDEAESNNWKKIEEMYPFAKFSTRSTSELGSIIHLSQSNFFFSQSCLEHIDNDKYVIDVISEYAKVSKKQILQYHLIPSASCLWLYGLHGIRIYTLPMICQLIKSVDKTFSNFELYVLGGRACLDVHKHFIGDYGYFGSNAKDTRQHQEKKYWIQLKNAIEKDLASDKINHGIFYALKISHNFQRHAN